MKVPSNHQVMEVVNKSKTDVNMHQTVRIQKMHVNTQSYNYNKSAHI